ncbi:Hypothetical predicted protein [Cloeon dipterum]|uniref:Uncharacterized protein n=1 Tax=Cloeon dipterum TaxID=197152 RepID=A0A8S1E258_9INSE|nr:Hypothetical predicted protein [Cloeon dipterum]
MERKRVARRNNPNRKKGNSLSEVLPLIFYFLIGIIIAQIFMSYVTNPDDSVVKSLIPTLPVLMGLFVFKLSIFFGAVFSTVVYMFNYCSNADFHVPAEINVKEQFNLGSAVFLFVLGTYLHLGHRNIGMSTAKQTFALCSRSVCDFTAIPPQKNMSSSNQQTNVVGGGQLAGPVPELMLDKLNKDFAVHRLFTFPLEFYRKYSIELLVMVAELGFYFENPNIRCQFCKVTIDGIDGHFAQGTEAAKKRIQEKHDEANYPIGAAETKNLSMAIVTSSPDYRAEAHRLYSLLKKPDWQHVTPFDLAKSGFYYSGIGDNVVCIYCNLAVSDWEAGDTPDKEHQESNPDCPFLDAKQSITNFKIGSEHEADANHDALGTLKSGTTIFDPNRPPDRPNDRGSEPNCQSSEPLEWISAQLLTHVIPCNPNFVTYIKLRTLPLPTIVYCVWR